METTYGGDDDNFFNGDPFRQLRGLAAVLMEKRSAMLDSVCMMAVRIVIPDIEQRNLFLEGNHHIPGLNMVSTRIDLSTESLAITFRGTKLVEAKLYSAIEARETGAVAIVRLEDVKTLTPVTA